MKAFVLRLPDDLYQRLAELSKERGQSMNQLVNIWVEIEVARANRVKREKSPV